MPVVSAARCIAPWMPGVPGRSSPASLAKSGRWPGRRRRLREFNAFFPFEIGVIPNRPTTVGKPQKVAWRIPSPSLFDHRSGSYIDDYGLSRIGTHIHDRRLLRIKDGLKAIVALLIELAAHDHVVHPWRNPVAAGSRKGEGAILGADGRPPGNDLLSRRRIYRGESDSDFLLGKKLNRLAVLQYLARDADSPNPLPTANY